MILAIPEALVSNFPLTSSCCGVPGDFQFMNDLAVLQVAAGLSRFADIFRFLKFISSFFLELLILFLRILNLVSMSDSK